MTTAPARLDAASLRDRLNAADPPRLLDVRTPGEFSAAHINGSYNVPLDTLKEHRDELRTHLSEVVLICRTGNRAAQAEQALAETGLTNVHVLDGGIVAWEANGGPLNREAENRWELERQVRLVAGSLVAAGVVASLFVPGAQVLSGLVGAGLVVAAVTNTCTMGMLLSKLPYNRGPRCDLPTIVERLTQDGRPS
ncbi:rhodanese-like domain-containing protein [Actinomadura latina]|uniref:Rhodanese-like domain-containing protein n=1 Tax=Actinomadura latina TaxID=163603 RepID=A0A846Z277_9ACTN|nr:rhodanese-like domain-containing protein [Actinomadura latina]NKZ06007.1 rhodanese-like domain-containing protein [Actinomadura latina]